MILERKGGEEDWLFLEGDFPASKGTFEQDFSSVHFFYNILV
jgi:hypothetical protein